MVRGESSRTLQSNPNSVTSAFNNIKKYPFPDRNPAGKGKYAALGGVSVVVGAHKTAAAAHFGHAFRRCVVFALRGSAGSKALRKGTFSDIYHKAKSCMCFFAKRYDEFPEEC